MLTGHTAEPDQVYPLPRDLSGGARGCVVEHPDVTIDVGLDATRWASVMACAMLLHSGSDQVVLEVRLGGQRAKRRFRLRVGDRPDLLPAEDVAEDESTEVLVCDFLADGSGYAVVLQVGADGAALTLDHGLFTEATRHRFADHVEICARAEQPVGCFSLPGVTVAVTPSTIVGSAALRLEDDWGDCVVSRLWRVAAEHPENTAVALDDRAWSYRELVAWIAGLAQQLGELSYRPQRIAVLAGHGVEAVAGVLSALAVRAMYIPLDASLPDGRLRRTIRQARPDVLLYEPSLGNRAQALLPSRARAMPIEPCSTDLPAPSASPVPSSPAYVLFTSGTTGTPKGVCQSVSGLVRNARIYRDSVALAPGEVVPLLASVAFDAAVMDLFGGLLSGATVHIVNPRLPAAKLRAAIARRPPSVLHATPTLMRHLLGGIDSPWPELTCVRVVVFGGERVAAADVEAVRTVLPTAAIINGLGPSECTLALQHVFAPEDPVDALVPIGVPVPGVSVALSGVGGSSAVTGELLITGAAVAIGYLGQQELTRQRFQENADGTRTYRTGDRAWLRPDGTLVFLGRGDRQLKIRGQRVEPQEIEAILQAHPTVAQAAVTLDCQEQLVAYVTAATAFRPVAEDVLRFATRQLSAAAVPTRVIAVDAIPMGPTGKRDLAALAHLVSGHESTNAEFTPGQRRVAEVWSRLLGHDRFSSTDDFLLAGGDSLLMMRLCDALEREFGVKLDLLDVMATRTIEELATLCERLVTQEMVV